MSEIKVTIAPRVQTSVVLKVGATGLPGAQGIQGIQGPQGDSITGPQGSVGPQGQPGVKGDTGEVGPQGASITGPEGPQGIPGVKGDKGDPGDASTVPGPVGAVGPQGPQGVKGDTGITDASLLTTGTLSDSRLSANVSLDNQNNNFSASQTFAGSANTAPNQTAASGSSIMTRDLVDLRSWQTLTPAQIIIPCNSFGFNLALSATSAFSAGGSARALTSASVLGSTGWMNAFITSGISVFNHNNNGGGGSNLRYDKKWSISFTLARPFTSTNTSIDVRLTNQNPSTTPLYTVASTELGCGMKITSFSGSTASFQCYRGTGSAVTYSTPLTGQAVDDVIHFRIHCDGAGNVIFAMYKVGTGWVTLGTVARPVLTAAMQGLQFSAINNGVTAEAVGTQILGSVIFTDLDALA